MLLLEEGIEDELYDDLKIMFSDVVMDYRQFQNILPMLMYCVFFNEIASDNNYVSPVYK